jgi:hypothetical protein
LATPRARAVFRRGARRDGAQDRIAFIYVTGPARCAELLPKPGGLLASADGAAEVLDATTEAHARGRPTPAENEALGERIVHPKPGYSAADAGFDGIFLARGAGIERGVKLDRGIGGFRRGGFLPPGGALPQIEHAHLRPAVDAQAVQVADAARDVEPPLLPAVQALDVAFVGDRREGRADQR